MLFLSTPVAGKHTPKFFYCSVIVNSKPAPELTHVVHLCVGASERSIN